MLQYLKYGEMPSPPEERRATNRWLQQLGRVGQRGFDFLCIFICVSGIFTTFVVRLGVILTWMHCAMSHWMF